jgi:hypothetical protein
MSDKISLKRINIKNYDVTKRDQLLKEVHEVIFQIFDISLDQLRNSFYFQSSAHTYLYLFYSKNVLVGINLINIYELKYKKSDYSFFRFMSAILPQYRGGSNIQKIGFKEAFKYVAKNPARRVYYLSPFIHPSSYAAACKVSNKIYPSLKNKVSQRKKEFMIAIADSLGFERVENKDPLIRNMHATTKENKKYTPKRISNRAKYFMKLNPDYIKGYGLITLIPLDFKNVTKSFLAYYSRK